MRYKLCLNTTIHDHISFSPAHPGYPQQTYGYQYPPQQQAYAAPPGYTAVGQHAPQGGVVLAQPGVVPTQVVVANVIASPPPDHMIFNIFMTLFCCWPIGIFAIMKSMACRDAINRGDAQQAIRLSKEARRLGYWTLGIGVLTVAVSIIMLVIIYAIYIPSILHNSH